MLEERIKMSLKDLDRLHILEKVRKRLITQVDAARMLGISDRQVRNLLKRLENEGPGGIVSRLLGKPSNRRLSADFKELTIKVSTITENDPFGDRLKWTTD